jgi:hypothetical protein
MLELLKLVIDILVFAGKNFIFQETTLFSRKQLYFSFTDFRIPESYQASLGLEREIAGDFKVEVNYVFNRGLHLWREINANAPRLPAGFDNFTDYLLSRDFDNSRNPATGQRPITATGNADVARFSLSRTPSQTIAQGGRRIIAIGLNNPSTANNSIGRAGKKRSK